MPFGVAVAARPPSMPATGMPPPKNNSPSDVDFFYQPLQPPPLLGSGRGKPPVPAAQNNPGACGGAKAVGGIPAVTAIGGRNPLTPLRNMPNGSGPSPRPASFRERARAQRGYPNPKEAPASARLYAAAPPKVREVTWVPVDPRPDLVVAADLIDRAMGPAPRPRSAPAAKGIKASSPAAAAAPTDD